MSARLSRWSLVICGATIAFGGASVACLSQMQASSGPGLPPDAIDDIHARIVYQAQAVLADSTIDLSIKAMNAPAEPERDREGIEVEVGG